jgi:putative endonuclease
MGITQSRGRAAENLVASYFELRGAEVVARNVRAAGVEIDLVVDEGGTQVLVEVKYRGRSDFGGAAQSLGWRQRERLLRAAGAWSRDSQRPVRVDVVALELDAEGARLRHYRNAVTESSRAAW